MKTPRLAILSFSLSFVCALLPAAALGQALNQNYDANGKPSPATGVVKKAKVAQNDRKFVRTAAQSGVAAVELGKLATEKGSSEEVKKFGQRMVEDHNRAAEQLRMIAGQKGIVVPQQLSPRDKMTRDRLAKLSGDQFDKAYITSTVKDQTQNVADFQRESQSGADSVVKDFAAKTLPELQERLQQAKEMTPMAVAANSGQ
jgi:putative membrane protein